MPTGYTAGVADGTITDFPAFAMRCARNFGALILMRDEPSDAPVPDEFKPSDYYENRVAETNAEIKKLSDASDDEIAALADAANQQAAAYHAERRTRNDQQKQRYETMLAEVEKWQPPSPDHEGMKSFMVQQLKDSIEWDCSAESDDPAPAPVTPEAWRASRLKELGSTLAYAVQHQREEIERTENRNRWLRQLRESLAESQPA